MPNGYTHIIYDDKDDKVTFEDYMFECTRAFGARIRERDDRRTEENRRPILPIKPDISYYEEALQENCEELAEINGLSMEEYIEMRKAEIDDDNRSTMEYNRRNAATYNRYEQIIAEAQAWTPPTEEHNEFKAFMLKHLIESQEFDCRQSSLTSYPTNWVDDRKGRTQYLADSIRDYEEKIADNIAKAESATEWLRAIIESVE